MKEDQIEKRVNWLDEQRRKDADIINLLERKFEEAETIIEKQENQLKELSSEITRLSAVATQIRQFDEALTKQRDDFSKKLSEFEELNAIKQRHIEDLRKHDYEEISKSVAEVQVGLQEGEQIKDLLQARRQEEARIAREMDAMDGKVESLLQKSEENSRGLHTFEEARKIDTRRISDLQSESTELRMKLDTVRGKQDSLEDRIRRAETRVDEIAAVEATHKEIYTLWEEKQELRMVEFEKIWRGWQTTFDEFQKKADEVDDKILKYDENYRALTKARSELDKLIERLERRITEVSEMQRIGEERSKQEWASFQADQQKRWNTYKLTNDEMWREHGRTHEKLTDDLNLMNEQLSECIEAIEDLNEKSQQRVMDLLNIINVWSEEIEKRVSEVR